MRELLVSELRAVSGGDGSIPAPSTKDIGTLLDGVGCFGGIGASVAEGGANPVADALTVAACVQFAVDIADEATDGQTNESPPDEVVVVSADRDGTDEDNYDYADYSGCEDEES